MGELLKASERSAVELILKNDVNLVSDIPDKACKDVFGASIPGMRTYLALEKKGAVIITDEEPIVLDNGEEFTFTSGVELDRDFEIALINHIKHNSTW